MVNFHPLPMCKSCILISIYFFFFSNLVFGQVNLKDKSSEELDEYLGAQLDSIMKIESKNPVLAIQMSQEAKSIAKKNKNLVRELQFNNRIGQSVLRTMDKPILDEFLEEGERLSKLALKPKGVANFYYLKYRYFSMVGPKDSVDLYLNKELNIREEIKDTTGIIGSYFNLANNSCDDIKCSLIYLRKAYNFAQIKKDSLRLAIAMGNMGNQYLVKSRDLDSSMFYFVESNKIFRRLKYNVAVAQGYFNMGKVYKFRGDYKNAIEYQIKHLNLREELGDIGGQITALHQLSNIYSLMDRPNDGLVYLLISHNLAKSKNSKRNLVHSLNSLGEFFIESNQDSALYYFNKCLELSEEIGEEKTIGAANTNIGKVYSLNGQFKIAEKYMNKGLEFSSTANAGEDFPVSLLALSEMYLDWFDQSKEANIQGPNLLEVEKILNRIEERIETNSQFEIEETLYKNYIRIYRARNENIPLAMYQEKLITLRDSFIEHRNIEVANDFAEKLKTADKEKEILALESKNKIVSFRNKMFACSLAGLGLFFSALFFFYKKLTTERNIQRRLKENQEFRTRISRNLHDDVSSLLNSLAMQSELAAVTVDHSNKKIYEEIAIKSRQAVDNLRDTVWAIDSSKDKFENLLDRIVDYGEDNLSIKNFEFKVDKVNWKSELDLNPAFKQNIYLIFKESVTNILKHSTGTAVKLIIGFKNQNFIMSIHDNGSNFIEKKSGVGMSSIKKRAKELGGHITFKTTHGFLTDLQIPL